MSSMTIPSKKEIADTVVMHSCTRNCLGIENNAAGCCTVGERDYIIGPIPDALDFLKQYNASIDSNATYDEVFVEHKEGKQLFPDRETWQDPQNFPALRLQMDQETHPCRFLGDDNLCTVHQIRSQTCRAFTCGHVSELLERLSLHNL